jgi:hypothetical protein
MPMLRDLAERLTLPGMPEWSGLVALIVLLLLAGCFLLMPFSVFGLKGRLDAIETQLDEMRAEIRALLAPVRCAPAARLAAHPRRRRLRRAGAARRATAALAPTTRPCRRWTAPPDAPSRGISWPKR